MITWVIPDLDFGDLGLWLADLDAAPVVFGSLSAAIGTIPQNELVLSIAGRYFIHSDKVVVVAELFGGWEVSVLQALKWQVGIRESGLELFGFNLETVLFFFD